MNRFPNRLRAGVTRTEVLFTVAAAAVLVLVALGFQFRTRFVSKQARCAQNMKDIVLGYMLWMGDHAPGSFPWRVDVTNGGNLGLDRTLTGQSWFQFSWISNELASPKALADPADTRKGFRPATLWGSDPNGGLSSSAFRNNSCSYGLGIDVWAHYSGPILPDYMMPMPVLLLDRHLSDNRPTYKCWFTTNLTTLTAPFNAAKWGKEVHGENGGNLGLIDGSVAYIVSPHFTTRFYGNIDLRARALEPNLTVDEAHFLFPD